MAIERWRERQKQKAVTRAADDAVAEQQVRAVIDEVIDEVVGPLVAQGLARVSFEADEGPTDWITIDPTRPDAAAISVSPNAKLISVCVGPDGNLHEVLAWVYPEGWKDHLRSCIASVVEGRYTEQIMQEQTGQQLVMTFGTDGGDIVVGHVGRGGKQNPVGYGPLGKRSFAPYAEAA